MSCAFVCLCCQTHLLFGRSLFRSATAAYARGSGLLQSSRRHASNQAQLRLRRLRSADPSNESVTDTELERTFTQTLRRDLRTEVQFDRFTRNNPRKLAPKLKIESTSKFPVEHVRYILRVNHAAKERDVGTLVKLWDDAKQSSELCVPTQAHDSPRSPDNGGLETKADSYGPVAETICNRFMTVFMGLRQRSHAMRIWDYLVESGQKPSQRSWNALLAGCVDGQDFKTAKEVWEAMRSAKELPDVQTWTTWIDAHIQCGKHTDAINVLNHMGRAWLKAVGAMNADDRSSRQAQQKQRKIAQVRTTQDLKHVGDKDAIVKPTIACVNIVLSGCARAKDVEAAERLVFWTESLGIELDDRTYNLLISVYTKTRNTRKAFAILDQLRGMGKSPDVIIYTTIIDAFLQNLDPSSSVDPGSLISEVLAEMSSNSIEASQQSYTTIIKGLLQSHRNLDAANHVFAYMSQQGVPPSQHIYTLLLQHISAFHAQDQSALDRLQKSLDDSGLQCDHILYDQLIEAYAAQDRAEPILRCLSLMVAQRQTPGFRALAAALKALVRAGDIKNAEKLARDEMKGNWALSSVRRWHHASTAFREAIEMLRAAGGNV